MMPNAPLAAVDCLPARVGRQRAQATTPADAPAPADPTPLKRNVLAPGVTLV